MSERAAKPDDDEQDECEQDDHLHGGTKQERGNETGNEKLQDEGQREQVEGQERTSAGSGREGP